MSDRRRARAGGRKLRQDGNKSGMFPGRQLQESSPDPGRGISPPQHQAFDEAVAVTLAVQ